MINTAATAPPIIAISSGDNGLCPVGSVTVVELTACVVEVVKLVVLVAEILSVVVG